MQKRNMLYYFGQVKKAIKSFFNSYMHTQWNLHSVKTTEKNVIISSLTTWQRNCVMTIMLKSRHKDIISSFFLSGSISSFQQRQWLKLIWVRTTMGDKTKYLVPWFLALNWFWVYLHSFWTPTLKTAWAKTC